MTSLTNELASALQLPLSEDCTDEEISSSLATFLAAAIHDDQPRYTLTKLFHEISQADAGLLNPLDTLPLLLPCVDPAAQDILSLMGERSAAKEVLIAVQEAIECVESFEDDVDDGNRSSRSLPSQLIILVGLYASSVPRLRLRRKAALETIPSLLLDLEAALRTAGARSSRDEGRGLVTSVSHFVSSVAGWITTIVDVTDEEILACKTSLRSTVDCAVTSCAHCLRTSLTQRCFEKYFPRFTIRSSVDPDWENGTEAVFDAIDSYKSLQIDPTSTLSTPTTSTMILLAHSTTDTLEAKWLLSSLFPVIMASIQSNSALDEALAILLKSLEPRATPRPEWSPDIIIPLCTVLPPLCSSHPNPAVRHQLYRILSLLLASASPPLRLQLLKDLTTDSDLPQMSVASVGLVKEAFLEAISSSRSSIFASPMFLQAFGAVLFRPNPPDLFSSGISLDDFLDSPEPSRLIECFALYYVVLLRDKSNTTGVCDLDMVRHIEKTFLHPVRTMLTAWMSDLSYSEVSDGTHARLSLSSLQLALERVDGAKAELFGTSTT